MKRLIDIIGSIGLLIVLFPIILLIGILVRINLGAPIFYKQLRAGKHTQMFYIYKFRSMTNERDEIGNLFPDDARITTFGNFLRKTSLDELPQLFNVLKGEMSFVGPRPLIVRYVPYYTDRENKRHDVRPGITGLAQVFGRNQLPWKERLELDVQYVEKQSLILDLKILFRTIQVVLKRDGILVDPSAETAFDEERQFQYLSQTSRNKGGPVNAEDSEASRLQSLG
jgi:lipopolysaccharide/colanic/teichoic acid biosynthesis glycosyltransferase